MRAQQATRGFTLIELMITLGLLAILLTLGLSSSYWSERSRSREAVSQLGAAYSKARALAVRNPAMVGPGMAAATVCLSGDAIHVHVGLPADCGIDSLWRATLSGGSRTQVFADAAMSTDFACIAVDNRARIVAANVDDATCTTASEITVRHGGWNVEASLI